MRIVYHQVITQRYLESVLINVGGQEHYFPDADDYLLVEKSRKFPGLQIHQ